MVAVIMLVGVTVLTGILASAFPGSFLPDEDQGISLPRSFCPTAASLQRTDEVMRQVRGDPKEHTGRRIYSTVTGYNFLSWREHDLQRRLLHLAEGMGRHRKAPEEQYGAILKHVNASFAKIPAARAFAFSPPAIPGIGTSGGVTFMLQDRSGKDVAFLAENVEKFVAAARERKELAGVTPMSRPPCRRVFLNVDREKVLKQNVELSAVYQTLQTFMGSYFVNYFNRFGRQWQVFVQAEGDYRRSADQVGQFFVKNKEGDDGAAQRAARTRRPISGPEFTMRYNLYRSAQINATAAPVTAPARP